MADKDGRSGAGVTSPATAVFGTRRDIPLRRLAEARQLHWTGHGRPRWLRYRPAAAASSMSTGGLPRRPPELPPLRPSRVARELGWSKGGRMAENAEIKTEAL